MKGVVCPTAICAVAGFTVIDVRVFTVSVVVCEDEANVTLIVDVPPDNDCANPYDPVAFPTVATAVFEDVQVAALVTLSVVPSLKCAVA